MEAFSTNDIFSEGFLNTPVSQINETVSTEGYFVIERAVRPEFVDRINRDLADQPIGINVNDVAPVMFHKQIFFAHALAASEAYFNLLTNSHILNLCQERFADSFRLKCHRYYKTLPGYKMGWHTDNKTTSNVRTNVAGLIFIIYMQDTNDGELQLVKGSHKWSGDNDYNDYTDEYIQKEHADSILTLSLPAGSMVVYDTFGIHRAKPISSRDFVRKSIFFQVDNDVEHSEKLLLNPEFLKSDDPRLPAYLGFGKPTGYEVMPDSSIGTITSGELTKLASGSMKLVCARMLPLPVARFLRRVVDACSLSKPVRS